MKLIVEHDDGKKEVFDRITDLYIAVRREDFMTEPGSRTIHPYPKLTSHSWGANVRELVKELHQSLIELQEFLREQRYGGSS